MKNVILSLSLSGVVATVVVVCPALQKQKQQIKELQERVIFCDSINEINCNKFKELDTTYDIGLEIYKKHLQDSK